MLPIFTEFVITIKIKKTGEEVVKYDFLGMSYSEAREHAALLIPKGLEDNYTISVVEK